MKSPAQSVGQAEAALAQTLDRMWTRFLPEIRERVAVLEAAAEALGAGKLANKQLEAAQAAAHKLAGTLGTFGLMHGTDLARKLELTFVPESAPSRGVGKKLAATVAELRAMVEGRKTSA